MSADPLAIRIQIEQLTDLPPLPEVARKILQLRASPQQDASALAAVIELDPSLSAQVLRYARSSLYNYRGRLESTEDAISRVLGYELVLNLGLALAAAQPFRIPRDGPLGHNRHWSIAVQSAVVAQTLAYRVPTRLGCRPAVAYLAGLLHNFGLLVLGHLYPEQYARLNRILEEAPESDLEFVEIQLFGMTHGEAGARALRFWELPDELVVTALKCHDQHYRGLYESFAHVVGLAKYLLLAPPNSNVIDTLPSRSLAVLDLKTDTVANVASKIASAINSIDSMLNRVAI